MPEFVIVGGGVYGCGLAWELSRRGGEVCLLESSTIAGGASGGLGRRGVRANGRDVRELPLMRMAYDVWPTLHEQLGSETGYAKTGHLLLVEREEDCPEAAAQTRVQTRMGIASTLLSQDEVREREPFVSERIIAAVHCQHDGVADHSSTTRSYAQAARRLGAEIREQTAMTALERDSRRVTALITDQGDRISVGSTVILASNGRCLPFLKQQLGLALPIWTVYPQVCLTVPVAPVPLEHLIGHAHRKLAMKIVSEDRVMISGGWRGRLNPDTQRPEVVSDQVHGNLAEAAATFPCLAGVSLTEATADRPESISIDRIPIVDYIPGAENLLVATGWSGHGWAIAPAVCRLISEWITSREKPELLEAFGLKRFGIR